VTPPAATGRVFISYRRQETAYPAGWLYDRLVDHLGRDQVFKDVDSIELGDDFVEVITRAVGSCDVLLALIGDAWLTITDEHGRRRLDDPDDFVRLEIEAALRRKVRVIPILVEGARMPEADELPPSLGALVRRQGLELSPSRFDFDTSQLLRVLDRTFAEVRTGPTAPPEPTLSLPTTRVPDGPTAGEAVGAPPREAPDGAAPSRLAATPGPSPPHDPRGTKDPTKSPEPTSPAPAAPPAKRPGSAEVARWIGRPIRLVSAAAVLLVAVVVTLIIVVQAHNRNAAATHQGQTPNGSAIPAQARPADIAVGEGAVWVANPRHATVSRIDPATRKVTTIKVGQTPSGVAVGEGAVWVANNGYDSVSRIDPATNRVETIDVKAHPAGVAVGEGAVWVGNSGDNTVSRIDPATNRVVATTPVGPRPQNLAVGAGAVWVATGNNEGSRIDPADNRVGRFTAFDGTSGLSSGVAVGAGYVWVANNRANTVSLVNPTTGPELGWLRATIPVGQRPQGVTVGEGAVWVANSGDNTVSRISATSRRLVATIRVGPGPRGIAVGARAVWVAYDGNDTVSRVDPATGKATTIKVGPRP
jgi:YVTN family beta-propeller protein